MDILLQHKDEIDRLSSIYIIANTPRFLYVKLRGDQFVQKLGHDNSFEELSQSFITLASKKIETIEELTAAYVLYVSLTYKNYEEVFSFFTGEGKVNFEWFNDIRDIYISSYTHINEYTVVVAPQILIPDTESEYKNDIIYLNL